MTTSESINELATALAKAQAEIQGAAKDAANPFFKSKYADLASIREACNGPLTKHGLSIVQSPSFSQTENGLLVSVETRLLHSSGQWLAGELSAAPKDNGPQSIGSCITYLRRYALQSLVNVAAEDDDGEAAHGRQKVTTATRVDHSLPEAPPKGYDDWLTDLTALADTDGLAALEKSWKASPIEQRSYLQRTNAKGWEAIKARAKAADALASKLVTK